MINFFKKKKNLIDKMPYLSKNRNDLIIYDYKKYNNNKCGKKILKHSFSNNYLENYRQLSENRKINLKKFNYRNKNLSSCPNSYVYKNKFRNYYLPYIKKN